MSWDSSSYLFRSFFLRQPLTVARRVERTGAGMLFGRWKGRWQKLARINRYPKTRSLSPARVPVPATLGAKKVTVWRKSVGKKKVAAESNVTIGSQSPHLWARLIFLCSIFVHRYLPKLYNFGQGSRISLPRYLPKIS